MKKTDGRSRTSAKNGLLGGRPRGIRVECWSSHPRGGGSTIRAKLSREARARLIAQLVGADHDAIWLWLHGNESSGYLYVDYAKKGESR